MLNLLVAVLLAASTGAAPAQDASRSVSSQSVSPKCSAYQGKARADCEAKEAHPEANGPSTKGVEIDEAHRTAPENKGGAAKSTSERGSDGAAGSTSGNGNSSSQGRAPTQR
jgi:hypothetical protein